MDHTREPQYQRCLELRDTEGLAQLGLMSNQTWHDDPKRLTFVLARYKFVSKMLQGKEHVLEVGAADAFGTRIVLQAVNKLTAIDFDPVFATDVQSRADQHWPFEYRIHDMLSGKVPGDFDAAYSLDVLEHIPRESERQFVKNIADSMTPHGVLIVGSPSLESQPHASPASKAGHVNCKTAEGLQELMAEYFHHVFIFSMNDEVVHTGFYRMSNYLFAVCCSQK